MTNLNNVTESGSMPISMAVGSSPINQSATCEVAPEAAKTEAKNPAKPGPKKDLDHFKRELSNANLAFWRSTKFIADTLVDARLSLSPEEFQQLITEAQLDYTFVCKAVKQGADFRLNDPANEGILPEAFSARHEIMLMKESTFRLGVTKGIINADCKLADLRTFREQIEGNKGKKGKGKKGKGKKNVKAKPSASPATVAEPKPTSANDSTPPWEESTTEVEKAAVKAPVNNSTLRLVENDSAAAPATATATAAATAPAKGRIAIVLSKAVAGQHEADLDRLMEGIKALVKEYDFIGAVEVEVAA